MSTITATSIGSSITAVAATAIRVSRSRRRASRASSAISSSSRGGVSVSSMTVPAPSTLRIGVRAYPVRARRQSQQESRQPQTGQR
jgi:hypothetical protein